MASHFIITSSSYETGTRIALHYEDDEIEVIKQDRDKIVNAGSDISFAVHSIIAEEGGWQKVVESDAFFEGIKVCKDVEEFIGLIMLDRQLKGVEIASYILSKIKCSHLKLEKLVYLSFVNYLNNAENKRLFTDKIYAFDKGPVVDTVYQSFKDTQRHLILSIDVSPLATASRIRFAEDGALKLACINEVLEKFESVDDETLVELTHKSGGAWDRTDKSELFAEIKFDDIVKYDKGLIL